MNPAPPPTAAVVLPCHNGRPWLREQLVALSCQDFERAWELIVVDNASTDGSDDVVRSAPVHPMCSLRVVMEPSRGLNRARNTGVARSSAPFVAMCDADDVASSGWLSATVRCLEGGERFIGGPLDTTALNTVRARRMNGMEVGHPGTWEVAAGIRAAVGANCAFTRELWSRVGGFDESYRSGADDTEFGIRCSLIGAAPNENPDAVMRYRLHEDRRTVFRRAWRDEQGRVRIRAEFPQLGLRPPEIRVTLKAAAYCVHGLLLWPLISTERRDRVARATGTTIGRIVGSVRHATMVPSLRRDPSR